MPKISRTTRQSAAAAAPPADEADNPSEATSRATQPRRAALGDVSNRRSARLSKKQDDTYKTQQANRSEQQEVVEDASEVRRRSLRSSTNKAAEKATDKPKAAEKKKVASKTRARSASKSRDPAQPKQKKARVSKNTTVAKKPKAATSRVRTRPPTRDIYKKSGLNHLKKAPPQSGRGRPTKSVLCSEFLSTTDYKLVRKPFDSSKFTAGLAPHDRAHRKNDNEVSNYVTDIFQRLYNAETTTRPHLYIDSQEDINSRMRAILVDWLVEVHMKFRLVPDTLYLCVNIIDRYCSVVPVKRSKLQLVGVTALLLACKYEEIYPPEVRDCVYITDRAYTRQDVLDMEQDIVKQLEFKMTVPTAYPFLQRFLLLTQAEELTKTAANYYLERVLQEHDVLEYRPSLLAAAAVTLAFNNPDVRERDYLPIECPGIPPILLTYTGFDPQDIVQCAALMAHHVGEEVTTASRRTLNAVKKKFNQSKYQNISTEIMDPDIDDIPYDF